MKKVLIFGGTGFLGYHLCKKSLIRNLKVFSVSKNPVKKKRKLSKVKYIYFDASKFSNFKKINQNFDFIINSSGYGSHFKGRKGKKLYNEHISIAKNILKFLKKKKIEKLIQIGSSFEYGKSKSLLKENYKTKPTSYYGKAKLYVTNYFLKDHYKNNLPVTIFRLFQAYGPKQEINRLIPYVAKGLKENKTVYLTSGRQIRDFCHVDDISSAIFKSFYNKKSNGQIINLGSGKKISVYDLVLKIFKIIKVGRIKFDQKSKHVGENEIILPNIQKAKRLLNWKPKISINTGIKKIVREF